MNSQKRNIFVRAQISSSNSENVPEKIHKRLHGDIREDKNTVFDNVAQLINEDERKYELSAQSQSSFEIKKKLSTDPSSREDLTDFIDVVSVKNPIHQPEQNEFEKQTSPYQHLIHQRRLDHERYLETAIQSSNFVRSNSTENLNKSLSTSIGSLDLTTRPKLPSPSSVEKPSPYSQHISDFASPLGSPKVQSSPNLMVSPNPQQINLSPNHLSIAEQPSSPDTASHTQVLAFFF